MKRESFFFVCVFSIGLMLIASIVLFLRNPPQDDGIPPASVRFLDELGLYFRILDVEVQDGAKDRNDGNFTTVFSPERKNLGQNEPHNQMRKIGECDPRLRFCQMDSTMICVVSEKAEYLSVDYPFVTYDDEGYFWWEGKKYRLLDIPFIAVYYEFQCDHLYEWCLIAYKYDPKDGWEHPTSTSFLQSKDDWEHETSFLRGGETCQDCQ
ncbi:MAG: hypothetical protein II719_06075 [Clostridia bacterium]|nr:hypothetical protein [Clostridia bacterium]